MLNSVTPSILRNVFLTLLEMEGILEAKNQWKGSFQLPSYDQQFCQYMMDEYKDDYKVRDGRAVTRASIEC